MRTFLIMVVGFGLALPTWAGDAQVEIVISRDYAKTSDITINGTKVTGPHVLDELAKVHKDRGEEVGIIIKMPKSLTFSNWNDIRGLMGKIPFGNVRYFVFWPETQKMIEIQQVGPLLDMQGKPSVNQ